MSTMPDPVPTWTIRSPEDLGRALAGVRRLQGVSQDDLAELLGVHRSYIAELEAGQSVLMLERLLRAFRRLGAAIEITLPDESDGG
jgi:transcriptional regulator with XRE-family HTH domain